MLTNSSPGPRKSFVVVVVTKNQQNHSKLRCLLLVDASTAVAVRLSFPDRSPLPLVFIVLRALSSALSIPASICSLWFLFFPPDPVCPMRGKDVLTSRVFLSWIQFSSMSRGRSMSIPRFALQIQYPFFPRHPLRNATILCSIDPASCASVKHDSRPPGCQLPQGWHAYLVRGVVWCTWCRC